MKFGILNYSGQGQNIGDFMQLQGILKAYERLGVSESELIKVERNKLADYDGEYVILPMSCFLSKIRGTSFFPLSEKIIPVFLGLFNVDEYIAEKNKDWKEDDRRQDECTKCRCCDKTDYGDAKENTFLLKDICGRASIGKDRYGMYCDNDVHEYHSRNSNYYSKYAVDLM